MAVDGTPDSHASPATGSTVESLNTPSSSDGTTSAHGHTPSPHHGDHDDGEATTPDADEQPKTIRRRPVPGKGFRKSRSGCFNCKRRRVKCCETRPGCQSCRRMRLDCVYPAGTIPLRPLRSRSPCKPSQPSVNLDHLRFFRHFLVEAHPPHPHGFSAVWQDVAALSHDYDFLAHALLALGAQHLTLFTPSDYSVEALDLRVSALQGLNAAFSRPCLTAADGDARCAAAIALTWQSTYMSAPGSLHEFLVTMRGWMVVATTMTPQPDKSLFRYFTREAYVGGMKRHVCGNSTDMGGATQDPAKDGGVIDGFLASLQVLRPLCKHRTERRYLSVLEKLGRLARTSPLDALLQMAPCWGLTNKMTEDEFTDFADPTNHAAQVLLAHFLMLDRALGMHFLGTTGTSQFTLCKQVARAWIVNMASSLPVGYEKYMMWPLGLARGHV